MTAAAIPAVPMALYESDFPAFSDTLVGSFRRYGFAVIGEHGIEAEVINAANRETKAFFALNAEIKNRYHIPGQGGARGYTPFGIETAKGATHKDLKEFWHMGRDLASDHPYRAAMPDNIWPDDIRPQFREAITVLYAALDHLGGKILSAIAHSLDLSVDFFEMPVCNGNSVLRLLHYPPVDTPKGSIRAGAHEDINVITLLLGAEEAGLQVKDRDGQWLDINPPAGALVCNIGDMLQRLTNHVLPSTTHRVINPSAERSAYSRYSTPFFLHFAPDFTINTLENCVNENNPNRYPKSITADEYLQTRLREIKLT